MSDHSHKFVEEYDGMVAFGFSREIDENSLKVYLQKFSDDEFLKALIPRMRDEEINKLFEELTGLMKKHLAEDEYHSLFLKDSGHSHDH
jgi:hypothetical protein